MSQTILNLKGWKILLKSKGNNHSWGQHSQSIHALESLNWCPGENCHWSCCHLAVCALGSMITYLQAHSSAPLGSCPCIPQMNNSKAETGVSLWLSSSAFCKADLCQCSRVQFRPVHYFCADHYSGMGVTWCFWHLDHDWEEMMYVTKAVVL